MDAGHGELDLVADALLRTFSCMCCWDAEEQQAEEPAQEAGAELGVHLGRQETTRATSVPPSGESALMLGGIPRQ